MDPPTSSAVIQVQAGYLISSLLLYSEVTKLTASLGDHFIPHYQSLSDLTLFPQLYTALPYNMCIPLL